MDPQRPFYIRPPENIHPSGGQALPLHPSALVDYSCPVGSPAIFHKASLFNHFFRFLFPAMETITNNMNTPRAISGRWSRRRDSWSSSSSSSPTPLLSNCSRRRDVGPEPGRFVVRGQWVYTLNETTLLVYHALDYGKETGSNPYGNLSIVEPTDRTTFYVHDTPTGRDFELLGPSGIRGEWRLRLELDEPSIVVTDWWINSKTRYIDPSISELGFEFTNGTP